MSNHKTVIKYREDVLKELILYVAAKCGLDEHYGVLKLNKILFYSDFQAYKQRGKPITGAVYKKYTHGPAPDVMKRVRAEMVESGDAIEYQTPLPGTSDDGEPIAEKRLLALRTAKLNDILTADEIAIVDDVIERLRKMTGKAVSRMSHRHPGWYLPDMEQSIPYFAALLPEAPDVLSAADMRWAKAVAGDLEAGHIA